MILGWVWDDFGVIWACVCDDFGMILGCFVDVFCPGATLSSPKMAPLTPQIDIKIINKYVPDFL